ncbi:SDR family oxidoreductase [Roseobacter sinensis]|uniref:SDR family oxidoreductase n=1 Tax=Roseobacter sinensis TaxID=2931391 RepID=A0ABT3BJB2_9RHOB|nr:SDR family oxidoreductase [Roseobacter sp. WL0113]MCV3273635.1 SDR family oxidoreductase [Roseobacter sp. WL0113]
MNDIVEQSPAKTVLVVGGTSDIGRAVAAAYAGMGWTIRLAARDADAAERNAADIRTRSGEDHVTVHHLDILETETFAPFLDQLGDLPDTVVCVVGLLGDQERAQEDPDHAAQVIRTNFEGPALLLEALAQRFAERGHGLIVGVSSVAGDRGRASNYVYGAGKAGLTAYLSGLRNRLSDTDVRVVTVKPGFVRTSMTAGMDLIGPLTAAPEAVASRIASLQTGSADVVYVLRAWRLIMFIIRAIPEAVFKKLKL